MAPPVGGLPPDSPSAERSSASMMDLFGHWTEAQHRQGAPGTVASGSEKPHELPAALRERATSALGVDLSAVRLHTGTAAQRATEMVGANAVALGQDIYLNAGEYQPGTEEGDWLLAHELVHCAQQQRHGGGSPTSSQPLRVSEAEDQAEGQADAIAERLVSPADNGATVVGEPLLAADNQTIWRDPKKKKSKKKSGKEKESFNREDPALVRKSWQKKGIDPEKANKVEKKELLGHNVQVNEVVFPLVDKTNALYAKLSVADQKKIKDSILTIGGYNKRVTSQKGFSNHSIGAAVDINNNGNTKQNDHFLHIADKQGSLKDPLLKLVQEVTRDDPEQTKFDLIKDHGEKQLDASDTFNKHFPKYVQKLIEEAQKLSTTSAVLSANVGVAPFASTALGGVGIASAAMAVALRTSLEGAVKNLGASAMATGLPTEQELKDAIAKANASHKQELANKLTLIKANRPIFEAWLHGSTLDKKSDEKLVGMIPLEHQLLKVMLDAGWEWGGDWTSMKDYMHFEDPKALDNLKMEHAAKKTQSAKSAGHDPKAAAPEHKR